MLKNFTDARRPKTMKTQSSIENSTADQTDTRVISTACPHTVRSAYTLCPPKNETRIILNILNINKSIAMKFSVWYPDDLSYFKCIHNYTIISIHAFIMCAHSVIVLNQRRWKICHLTLVMFLHYLILHKNRSYVVFLSVVWAALKRTGFGVSEVAVSRCVVRSQ